MTQWYMTIIAIGKITGPKEKPTSGETSGLEQGIKGSLDAKEKEV